MMTVRQMIENIRRDTSTTDRVLVSDPLLLLGRFMDPKSRAEFLGLEGFDIRCPNRGHKNCFSEIRKFVNLSTGSNQSMNAINALVGHLTGIEYPHTLDGRRHPQSHAGSACIKIDRCTAVDSESETSKFGLSHAFAVDRAFRYPTRIHAGHHNSDGESAGR